MNNKIITDKQIEDIMNEDILFAEIIEKILINPYQLNWNKYDEYSYNNLASLTFKNTVHLMFEKKISRNDLLKKDTLENHMNKILKMRPEIFDSVYESYPDFYFEYEFLKYIKNDLKGNKLFWDASLWRIIHCIVERIFTTVKTENFHLYGKSKPYSNFVFDDSFNDKNLFKIFEKAFPELVINTKNKLIFPYGVYTFRKLLQIAYKKTLKSNKHIYDQICKKYELFANNKLSKIIKNDMTAIVIENAIIKISKNKKKEVDLLIIKDDKITIFEHKGPISGWISDDKYYKGIFETSMKKSSEYAKLMSEGEFEILNSNYKILHKMKKIQTKNIFTSLIDWNKGLNYDWPTISLGSLVEMFNSFRSDTIKPGIKLLWNYINFKSKNIEYSRMIFNDYKSSYYSYLEGLGKEWNIYGFLGIDQNYIDGTTFIDIEESLFVISNKQFFNCLLHKVKSDFEILYPYFYHAFVSKKIFGFVTQIPIKKYEEFCVIGFSSNKANKYFKTEMELLHKQTKQYFNRNIYLFASNLRLRGIEDYETQKKIKPFYDSIK